MNFLNPLFLLGLLAVAIPIAIHLISLRRPEKLAFPTLAFFNSLQKSTLRRIRIKQYILMVLRATAVLLLALALARPFLPPAMSGFSGSNDHPKAIVILLDNSPSMSRIGADGPLIEQAREIAAAIVDGARADDRFIVAATNGNVKSPALIGASRARELIKEVEVANTGNYAAETVQLLYQQLEQVPMNEAVIYILSDGQKSQFSGLEKRGSDRGSKPVSLQMVKLKETAQPNLAVSSLALESQMLGRDAPLTLHVEVKNTGGATAVNHFVSLEAGNRVAGQYPVTLEPGQSQEFSFEIISSGGGDISGRVVLEGDEITYDNSRYFVVRIPETYSVLLIGGRKQGGPEFVSYLQPALEASQLSNARLQVVEKQADRVNQSEWLNHDITVLDGLREVPEYWFRDLQQYVQEGKGLLFFPSEQGNIQNYNTFLELFNAGSFDGVNGEYASFKSVAQMGSLIEGHPVLDELFDKKTGDEIFVDLPELFFFYSYRESGNTGAYTILRTETGSPLLAEQRFGDGKILISAIGADPGWSNFPVNPLFAPLYYRSVLYAGSSEQGGVAEHVLGSAFQWEGALKTTALELRKDGYVMKPEVQALPGGTRVRYEGREWEPGILEINAEDEKRLIAINQHIMESDFTTLTDKQLEKMLGNSVTIHSTIDTDDLSEEQLSQRLSAAGFGKEVWNWFIWSALILLIAETLISKLYRVESVS